MVGGLVIFFNLPGRPVYFNRKIKYDNVRFFFDWRFTNRSGSDL